ncbi:DMT family transporter [Streptomyces griseus]|uniref:SMR-type multi-drug efflux transporter n=1 Tax=Streptomyces griseus subsp. griseus (strain JCM 4626 / CBS 651.72 / NBRC 13350 / KCC S-0626 / ISP 5235) TaxID=455632 RepID=B1W4L0_STRGG|nr:multidrug efflux SMR transporter [Streptomyces griseus]MYR12518.1 QacE family quaternary ammonium compound efflux SMR transporter [Streptomyces sp. SID724]MYR53857.1 QacE family quaternary ammonium compound efflux SMR transporter [Streptomyces sp. SID4928]BAG23027.1 putative SMR-type multi-drug efflux transporter [Streptomyces griseus subsp. griseus NBRC 13350]MBW3708781.1 QacE family quaternary ammonium compound efflux SMR transporter [Streptomyces griseus]NEB51179.1 multidrug efflux SMR t
MPWLILFVSAVLEAVWATALGASDGFSRPVASVVFFVALILSMIGLSRAAKHIPIGVAYAVWTGTGAALTVAWAMVTGGEAASALKVLFLIGIIGCIAGLKLSKPGPTGGGSRPGDAEDRSDGVTAPNGTP